MTRGPLSARSSDTAYFWLACAIALGAGFYVAFVLFGTAIDREHRATGHVADTLLAQSELLAQRGAVEREERAADERLRDLDLGADAPAIVARFIHAASRVAAARDVKVDAVEARGGPASVSGGGTGEAGTRFDVIPLDITLSGTYRDLLAAIRALAATPIAMRIEVAAIERSAPNTAGGGDGVLTARLHVALQRLAAAGPASALTATTNAPYPQEMATHARSL